MSGGLSWWEADGYLEHAEYLGEASDETLLTFHTRWQLSCILIQVLLSIS